MKNSSGDIASKNFLAKDSYWYKLISIAVFLIFLTPMLSLIIGFSYGRMAYMVLPYIISLIIIFILCAGYLRNFISTSLYEMGLRTHT